MRNLSEILVYAALLIVGRGIGVFVHELGHVAAFCLQKIKIRAVYIFQFVWIKNATWKLVICKNEITRRGGLVIPDLDEITCQADWDDRKRKYVIGILGGVYSSIIITIILVPIVFLNINSFIRFLAFIIILYSILIIGFSVTGDEMGMGDIYAYRWLKQKELNLASEIYENLLQSTNAEKKIKNSYFLRSLVHNLLLIETKEYLSSNLLYNLIDYEITLVLTGIYQELDKPIYERAMECINHATELLDQPNSENNIILLAHCVEYLAFIERDIEAKQLYETIKNYEENDTLVFQYYKRQMNHILKFNNETEYLNKQENIQTSSNYKMYTVFPIYYEIEKRINSIA